MFMSRSSTTIDWNIMKYNAYTRQEELEAALTHGFGLLLSIIAVYILFSTMPLATDPLLKAGCGIYASTLILVYAISTLSHMYTFQSINTLLRRCDQGFIYLLIVGTATPFMSLLLSSARSHIVTTGIYISILLWSLAFIGCISKIAFAHRINNVVMSLYILLGWGEALALMLVRSEIGRSFFTLAYSRGMFLYYRHNLSCIELAEVSFPHYLASFCYSRKYQSLYINHITYKFYHIISVKFKEINTVPWVAT